MPQLHPTPKETLFARPPTIVASPAARPRSRHRTRASRLVVSSMPGRSDVTDNASAPGPQGARTTRLRIGMMGVRWTLRPQATAHPPRTLTSKKIQDAIASTDRCIGLSVHFLQRSPGARAQASGPQAPPGCAPPRTPYLKTWATAPGSHLRCSTSTRLGRGPGQGGGNELWPVASWRVLDGAC